MYIYVLKNKKKEKLFVHKKYIKVLMYYLYIRNT